MEYCCEFMKQQLTNDCSQHGLDCPDNVIQSSNDGKLWYLEAENATYGFKFCPACGVEIPKERQA